MRAELPIARFPSSDVATALYRLSGWNDDLD